VNELQQKDFEILKYFKKIAEENDINYFLYAGTLLGSVRHQGFIPWDDDIDIGMLRKDFEKFEEFFINSDYEKAGYFYMSRKLYPFNAQPFSKIRSKNMNIRERMPATQKGNFGPWIDIFPFDNIPNDSKKRREQYNKVTFYNNIIKKIMLFQVVPENKGLKRRFKVVLQKINEKIYPLYFFMPYIYKKRNKYMTMYNDVETSHVADLSFLYYKDYEDYSRHIFKKEYLEDFTDGQFETEFFKIPKKYDEILTIMYDEYMILPPDSERKTHNIEEV